MTARRRPRGEDQHRALRELARSYGIQLSFTDVEKVRRRPTRASLIAVLRAMGAPIESDRDVADALRARLSRVDREPALPVIVAWDGSFSPPTLPRALLRSGFAAELQLDDGTSVPADVGSDGTVSLRSADQRLPLGHHRLAVRSTELEGSAPVISAPRRCPEVHRPSWGTFLPLYAMRTRRDWGVGSFGDLAALLEWTRGLGGSRVGTLPLLAQFIGDPCEPGPYSPASRQFWNELFIDIEAVPEMRRSAEARELFRSEARSARVRLLRQEPLVDYRAAMAAKRPILEALARVFFQDASGERRRDFDRFTRMRPNLDDYARFRAYGERSKLPWPAWPARAREGRVETREIDAPAVGYHQYVQWIADGQLAAVSRSGEDEPGDGLYLDLPLGVNPASYDTWRQRNVFADGVSGGAPPDPFFPMGQAWGFPPLHPERLRDHEYAYVRACLGHLLRYAGVLRVDHMMGFHRLYWVPDGFPATEGVYVRYPAEELYAVLSLEAHGAGAAVVGEDLGTVPQAVRHAMARHGVLRSHVVQFEVRPDRTPTLRDAPAESLASLETHDLPTFPAYWECRDIADRRELGLLDADHASKERTKRDRIKRGLTSQLRAEGRLSKRGGPVAPTDAATTGTLKHLAASEARMVVVNLEDLWGETGSQNTPGTTTERPNWRRRAERTFEEFRSAPDVVGTLAEVDRLRRSQPVRRREDRA